jgi:DNA-directed RNA polymerase alpha subunit
MPERVRILNPDQYITTLEKGAKLNIQMRVEKGVENSAALRQKSDTSGNDYSGCHLLSCAKSLRSESTRVGQMTNLDKLSLEIMTDGSITPENAPSLLQIFSVYFNLFNQTRSWKKSMSDFKKFRKKNRRKRKTSCPGIAPPIEILGSRRARSTPSLTASAPLELFKCTESKLTNLRGFGKRLTSSRSAGGRNMSLSKNNLLS